MKTRGLLGVLTAIGVTCYALGSTTATAESVSEFYKGKNLSLIIGSGEGGSYDIIGRLIAQHLKDHIPGKPNIIPRNMPGASSVKATEYFYNVAPKDGTTLAFVQPTVVLNKFIAPEAKYEPKKFKWLGRLSSVATVAVIWHTAPAQTIEEIKKQEVVFGASGAMGYASMIPTALNHSIGTKFKVIRGYESMATQILATERGEIQGIGSLIWDYFPVSKPDWVNNKTIRPLYTIGLSRHPKLPDVPTIVELVTNDLDRDVMRLLAGTLEVGYSVMTTPNVPNERVDALRKAFSGMLKDQAFVAAMKKQQIEIESLPGPAVDKIVADVADMPANVVERMNTLIRP